MFTFFFRNPMGGFLITALIYMGIQSFALYRISKKRNIMNEQIPAFVSTFKANIQANQHAQNAMIRAIDSTASPLYDELAHAKSIMEAGDFRPGIIALRRSTDNETLRQMASCIELASSSGSNIEPQIEIIEEIIKDKQIMERKKKLGVNENKPLFIVAGLFVPVSFIGSYIMSEMHREFWFKSILSWLILIGIIIATGISMFATWKIIQSVEIG
jgi:Flp pilus assembly protein TadB